MGDWKYKSYICDMTNAEIPKYIHQGRNVKRFREMKGIKQEVLAHQLGDGWSQKKISQLENMEEIESNLINELATALQISPEAIENFSEEALYNVISNTFNNNSHDTSTFTANSINLNPTFNPLDEIKRLNDKMEKLYESLVKEKDEKIALLQKMVEKK